MEKNMSDYKAGIMRAWELKKISLTTLVDRYDQLMQAFGRLPTVCDFFGAGMLEAERIEKSS